MTDEIVMHAAVVAAELLDQHVEVDQRRSAADRMRAVHVEGDAFGASNIERCQQGKQDDIARAEGVALYVNCSHPACCRTALVDLDMLIEKLGGTTAACTTISSVISSARSCREAGRDEGRVFHCHPELRARPPTTRDGRSRAGEVDLTVALPEHKLGRPRPADACDAGQAVCQLRKERRDMLRVIEALLLVAGMSWLLWLYLVRKRMEPPVFRKAVALTLVGLAGLVAVYAITLYFLRGL